MPRGNSVTGGSPPFLLSRHGPYLRVDPQAGPTTSEVGHATPLVLRRARVCSKQTFTTLETTQGQIDVFFVNSHTKATRIRKHLREIDLRFSPQGGFRRPERQNVLVQEETLLRS